MNFFGLILGLPRRIGGTLSASCYHSILMDVMGRGRGDEVFDQLPSLGIGADFVSTK